MPVHRTAPEWDTLFESLMRGTRAAVEAKNFVDCCRYVDQFHTGLKEFLAGTDDECKGSVMFKSYGMVIAMLASAACRFAGDDIAPTSDVLVMVDRAMLKMQLQKQEAAILKMTMIE